MNKKSLNIFVIEDEFAARTKMVAMLSQYGKCGYAESGVKAINRIKTAIQNQHYFDLITIDIQLPDYNGIDLLADILAEEARGEVCAKKIMVTASSTPENVSRAAHNRCDDFLVKPIKKAVLHNRLIKLGIVTE
ncbi:MAG: response regulator [Candidatus Thiodiazotropha sp. (ex Lucinoma kastoroae)]|nr:response regulator [Candidatus Thiodiazotropha sp. (ex Lucinoma kastoroae)]